MAVRKFDDIKIEKEKKNIKVMSIFCEIFKNATAHRNQMNRFPATPSLPEAET